MSWKILRFHLPLSFCVFHILRVFFMSAFLDFFSQRTLPPFINLNNYPPNKFSLPRSKIYFREMILIQYRTSKCSPKLFHINMNTNPAFNNNPQEKMVKTHTTNITKKHQSYLNRAFPG